MEQRFFTVTIHRPMTRVERLRLRRRRFWSRVCLVLGILTAAAVLTAAVLAADSDARSEKPAQEISTTNPAPVLTLAVAEEPQEEPAEGQQAVAEVILNRVAAENFPDRIADVIHQENPQQFTTAPYIDKAEPGAEQYAAVDAALYGEPVLPLDVVYFSREPENGNLWGIIGGHSFCYQYNWK